MTPDEAIKLMLQHKVRRLKIPELEIELGPEAFQTDKPSAPGEVLQTVCPCGHDLITDHNDSGCLHGCPDDKCIQQEAKPASWTATLP